MLSLFFSVEAQLIFSRLFPFVNAGCSEFLRTSSASRAFISVSTQRDSRCWRITCLPADLLHYPVACVFTEAHDVWLCAWWCAGQQQVSTLKGRRLNVYLALRGSFFPSCNVSSATRLLPTLNFSLCLCCLFSPRVKSQYFLSPVSLLVSCFSPLSIIFHFISFGPLLSNRNFLLTAFAAPVNSSLSSFSFLSLPIRTSSLPASSFLSYHTDTSSLYNLCVAPLCSSSSYLIFHDTLPGSEWKKYAGS